MQFCAAGGQYLFFHFSNYILFLGLFSIFNCSRFCSFIIKVALLFYLAMLLFKIYH